MSKSIQKIILIGCILWVAGFIGIAAQKNTVFFVVLWDIRNNFVQNEQPYGIWRELYSELILNQKIKLYEDANEVQVREQDYSEYTWQSGDDSQNGMEEMILAEDDPGNDASCEGQCQSHDQDLDHDIMQDKNQELDTYFDSDKLQEVFSNISENNSISYSFQELADYKFLLSNCYNLDDDALIYPEEFDATTLLNQDVRVDLNTTDYKILIYHTHGSESFFDSRPNETMDTVIGMGDELTKILEEKYGVSVYHDRTVYDMVNGKLDRSYAYELSRKGVEAILEQYPSIEVVIDLHRDGVAENTHLCSEVDGKQTAKIMFVNGVSRLKQKGELSYLDNPNKCMNLAFSLKMHLAGKRLYGNLMRSIYVSGYRYNLDLLPRAALIEVGAQTNSVEEVRNAMEPLATILYAVLTDE